MAKSIQVPFCLSTHRLGSSEARLTDSLELVRTNRDYFRLLLLPMVFQRPSAPSLHVVLEKASPPPTTYPIRLHKFMTKISDSRLSQTLSSFSLLLLSGSHASSSMIGIVVTASTTPTEEFYEPERPATTTA